MLNNLFPNVRPRRLRKNKTVRDLVSETKLLKSKLIQPLFVSESISEKQPLDSMPGHFLFSKDSESLGERVEVVLFSENKQSPKKLLNFYYLDSLCNYLHTLCKKLYNISINQKTLRRFYNVNKSCLYI